MWKRNCSAGRRQRQEIGWGEGVGERSKKFSSCLHVFQYEPAEGNPWDPLCSSPTPKKAVTINLRILEFRVDLWWGGGVQAPFWCKQILLLSDCVPRLFPTGFSKGRGKGEIRQEMEGWGDVLVVVGVDCGVGVHYVQSRISCKGGESEISPESGWIRPMRTLIHNRPLLLLLLSLLSFGGFLLF
jgi:hypothetical protein